MDPNDTLNTSKAGRRAAMARDGRLDQATADTVQLKTQAAQHTPGPWTHHHIISESKGVWSKAGLVAETNPMQDEWMANARLIAAAPEMLEALYALLADPYLSDPINADRMAAASAAIAKATGAQS